MRLLFCKLEFVHFIQNHLQQNKLPQCLFAIMLTPFFHLVRFAFVNLPIKSNYYHKLLPAQITEALKLIKRQSNLNEKCFLLEHLSDLLTKDRKICLSSQQKKIISNQLNKWKDQSGRFQHIATVAWVIKRLNLQKFHSQLVDQIKQRFLNDEWYVNFDESVKALEVFKDLPQGNEKVQILQKIERNIGITMWNVHMKYYARIATGLLEAGRFKSQLWQRMEKQILQNLGMHYETRTLCDIFKAYALSQNGHDVFYQMMEKVLLQGHFNQYNFINVKNSPKQYDDSGDFFSLVIQTYGIASKACGVVLTPDFKDYVYEALMDRKTEYRNLGSLTKTIRSLEGFDFQSEEISQIQHNLLQKRPANLALTQIKQFYELMQQRHGHIPTQIHCYIQNLFMKDVRNKFIAAPQLVDFINFLLVRGYINDEKALIGQVNLYLESNFKYLYPQEVKYVTEAIERIKLLTSNQNLLKLPEPTSRKVQHIY